MCTFSKLNQLVSPSENALWESEKLILNLVGEVKHETDLCNVEIKSFVFSDVLQLQIQKEQRLNLHTTYYVYTMP